MSKKLGLILAAGLLVAGCGVGAPQVKDSGNVGVLDAPPTTYTTPTSSAPVTTEAPVTTSEAPVTSTPAQAVAPAPKTTAVAKPKAAPKTTAKAAPKPAACGGDYYVNSSGNCVHRPSDNPAGATAQCNDGSYSYSQHRSGTCSGHGGVRTWL